MLPIASMFPSVKLFVIVSRTTCPASLRGSVSGQKDGQSDQTRANTGREARRKMGLTEIGTIAEKITGGKTMDFSAWSPSHLIIAAITIATIIAHVTYLFSRLKATIERLCDRLDDTNHRIQSVDKRIDETNQQVADVRQELHQLNQNHIEHLNRHHSQ